MSLFTRTLISFVPVCFLLQAQQSLLVLQKHDDSLAWYEPHSGKQAGAIAKVGHIPHEFVVSADQRYAFVTNYGVDSYDSTSSGGNTLSVVDLGQHKTVREIQLKEFHRPHGIAIGRSGHLYVTCDLPPALLEVDPGPGKIVHSWSVKARGPHMVSVSSDESLAWTADALSGTITRIFLRQDSEPVQIPIGGVPMGLTLSSDDTRLYATTHADKVAIIETAKDRAIDAVSIPGKPARITWTPDHRYLLVATIGAGDVAVVDVQSLHVVHRFHAGRGAEGIIADAHGKWGYVSAQQENKVICFSLESWAPDHAIQTGATPDSLALIGTDVTGTK